MKTLINSVYKYTTLIDSERILLFVQAFYNIFVFGIKNNKVDLIQIVRTNRNERDRFYWNQRTGKGCIGNHVYGLQKGKLRKIQTLKIEGRNCYSDEFLPLHKHLLTFPLNDQSENELNQS